MFLLKFLRTKNFEILKYISILVLGWFAVLCFIACFGLSVLPFHESDKGLSFASSNLDFLLRFANWDGGHFRGIAENGYLHEFQVVFFPLYPLLIAGLMKFSIPSLYGGLIISLLSAAAALFFLYKLVLIDYKEEIAKKTLFITLAFPTAFYLGTVYSESLFLFLSVAAFFFAREKKWALALTFAALSSLTRLVGLAVIAAIALEYFLSVYKLPLKKEWMASFPGRIALLLLAADSVIYIFLKLASLFDQYIIVGVVNYLFIIISISASVFLLFFATAFISKHFEFKKIFTKELIYFLLSLTPFILYCLFLYKTQGNFFAFINHESLWQRHLNYPWSAPVGYFYRLLPVGFFQIGPSAQALIEFLFFIIFLVLLIISWFRMRISYFFFFAAALFIPISTGTLQAVHRYGLIIFPAMILLASIKNQTVSNLWIYFSLMLQGVLLVLFINGYWVS